VTRDDRLRLIRRIVDAVPRELWADFERLYCAHWPAVDPAGAADPGPAAAGVYSFRSERQLMEPPGYNGVICIGARPAGG
jgi:hypothetical protein